MKKPFVAILLSVMLSFTLLSVCGCGNANKYTLTVVGESDLLLEPLDKSCAAGETVTVKTGLLHDAVIIVKINGTTLQSTPVIEAGIDTYWEYTFTMPNKNSTLEIKTENGFIPPLLGIDNTIGYYDLALTSDSNIVGFKTNAYVPSLYIWEQIKPLIPNCTKNYDNDFFEQNALLVLFGVKSDGGGGKIENINIILDGETLYVNVFAEKPGDDVSAPAVMTEWVVVLEIENNIPFSKLMVNAYL